MNNEQIPFFYLETKYNKSEINIAILSVPLLFNDSNQTFISIVSIWVFNK